MHLMTSAPPISSRRTCLRTSAGDVTTPKRSSSGSRMSGASPTTSPPPHGAVMKAPAHCIRGPSSSPALIVSRRARSVKARNAPRSRTVVKPASSVTRALRTLSSASWAPVVVVPGTPAVWTSPTRWLWVSMSPGSTVSPDRSTTRVSSGRPSSGPSTASIRDITHEEDAVGGRLAALDVQVDGRPGPRGRRQCRRRGLAWSCS